jgi:hypothetical protein
MFVKIAGVKMSQISKIYYLLKILDNLDIKISEYQAAQRLEDDAYGRLWYEEKIDEAQKKLDRTKELLTELVKDL